MFNLDFAAALATLGENAPFRIANQARPPADYLFSTILPERLDPSYHVEDGQMTVRATMAGTVGMDAPYPPGGKVEISTFLERSAKIANEVRLPEAALRKLQELLLRAGSDQQATQQQVDAALNFLDKVILQAHMDTFEWLRGRALVDGEIDWTFNDTPLSVNYGVPAAHLLATRTIASGEAYGAADSLFWSDMREANKLLRWNRRAIIMHPDTLDVILFNDANNLEILSQEGTSFRVRRLIEGSGGRLRPDTDVRGTLTLVSYDREAEVFDPAAPDETVHVPFIEPGKVLHIAQNQRSEFRVGEGSTDDPDNDLELGYTHLAPTVEGNGQPGRWADLFTPEQRPMQLVGRAVTNGLPVIRAPEKIVVTSTEMPE